ncbi:MAG TPA: 4-hydroxy-3-methylbut-2-enyl diphosphate reductase [Candidatus Krumholzibacteria bacterium]|nr:4-hydroxy-3-methylbut-2-enyl diphosphate reductase [Candidatus Krumholzibacteria bacterium]
MRATAMRPRGFCAGVDRAIEIVDLALDLFPPPLYVRKEIVHNRAVVEGFRTRGVIFVDSLDEVPEGRVVIFSAHGVSPSVREDAQRRRLRVIDATCPLVTKVHLEVRRFVKQGYEIFLIGHAGHDEVLGTTGEAPERIHLVGSVEEAQRLQLPRHDKLVYLTQTTLSVDETRDIVAALQARFPRLTGPPKDDICYATQNRQEAVKALVGDGAQVVLVLGSESSSNSKRLCEVAEENGARAYLVDGVADIDPSWLAGVEHVGVTAGASAPEHLVQEVLAWLAAQGAQIEERELIREDVQFGLPPELAASRRGNARATGAGTTRAR